MRSTLFFAVFLILSPALAARIARHLGSALLVLGLIGASLLPAVADNADTVDRLRSGTLLNLKLGDSLDDFRRAYGPQVKHLPKMFGVKKHVSDGKQQGYLAFGAKTTPPENSWRLGAYAGLDERIYRIVVTQYRWRLVSLEEVTDALAHAFGAPSGTSYEFVNMTYAYWGRSEDAALMEVRVRYANQVASDIEVDLVDRDLERQNQEAVAAAFAAPPDDLRF
jgi:hypothetical protein